MAPPPRPSVAAAQYLRRSTGLQSFSFEQQELAIAAYAAARGIRIIATYRDERSGLDLRGRPGLRDLLAAALGPAPPFRTILVHDVSRWGRFQDLDQGAHYEFLCRKAGIAVAYCVEPFDNDGSPEANLIKSVKRSMAAEYSRALSERIASAKHQLAAKGYFQTGTAAYGYRRVILDPAGQPRAVLERGEQKIASDHRVVLRPGPDHEVATVARIFRLYALSGLKAAAIAELLNGEGLGAGAARAWTAQGLRRLLANEVYVGTYVFGKSRRRLRGRNAPQPEASWVRVPDAFPGLVSPELFAAAQLALRAHQPRSDAEMLDDLRALLAQKQRLDTGLIDEAPGMLGACAYIKHFGGLRRAYALIGYSRSRRGGSAHTDPSAKTRHAADDAP